MNIVFEKWHGAGNDFIFIDNWQKSIILSPEQIQQLCHRQFGIGADAVILFEPSDTADCKMNYINADGTVAETCGNGLRCAAAFGLQHGHLSGEFVSIENPSSKVDTAEILTDSPWWIRINMGASQIRGVDDFPNDFLGKTIEVDDKNVEVWCVSMGNPHAVQFVSSTKEAPVLTQGAKIEHHNLFPNRINAEYLEVLSSTEANLRVWERGCGETLACGSGAAAATVAGVLAGKFLPNTDIVMHLPGGDLTMQWNQAENIVFKTGPAEFVYHGAIVL